MPELVWLLACAIEVRKRINHSSSYRGAPCSMAKNKAKNTIMSSVITLISSTSRGVEIRSLVCLTPQRHTYWGMGSCAFQSVRNFCWPGSLAPKARSQPFYAFGTTIAISRPNVHLGTRIRMTSPPEICLCRRCSRNYAELCAV